MAVEIPVVVDIEKAFQDAANRVSSAIKPLEGKIRQETKDLELKVGVDVVGEGKDKEFIDRIKTVNELLTVTRKEIDGVVKYSMSSFEELSEGIQSAKERLQELSAIQQRYGLSSEQLGEQKSLQEAIFLLRQEIDLRSHNAELVDRQAQTTINAKRAEEERLFIIQKSATTMSQMSEKMAALQGQLQNTTIGSDEWLQLLETIKQMRTEIEQVQKDIRDLGQETGSLDALNSKLQDLQKEFSSMGKVKLFDAEGNPTAELERLQKEYADTREESEKIAEALHAEYDARKRAREEAEKEAEARKREAAEKARLREEGLKLRDTLNMEAKSMNDLNAKLAAWRQVLNAAEIDSPEWRDAAIHIRELSEEIAKVNTELKAIGLSSKNIDRTNATIQRLTESWNSLDFNKKWDGGAMTSEARAIYDYYKAMVKKLQEQGVSMEQILQKEQSRKKKAEELQNVYKRENAILNSTVNTISLLQEKERILSSRLSKAVIGSSRYERLKQELERVRAELAKVNGEVDKTDSKLENLVKNSIRLIGLHAAGRFVRNVREVTAEFELQRVSLGSIIQDTERAESLFRKIKAAAIESPFEIKDLVSYTKQLSAYQIETDKLFDTTKKLADVSAGLGVDMGRLILAYGQVRAASVLRGQELRQFTEAGVPLVDKLAEKFSELRGEMVSTGEVFQLISERAVPFRMIEEIFNDMTSAGGIFYKMQEKQAKTLAGQWANLKDAASIMYDEIGNTEGVHQAMEDIIALTRSMLKHWRDWASVIKVVGSGLLTYYGIAKSVAGVTKLAAKATAEASAAESIREKGMRRFITSLIGKTTAEKISTAATDAHTWAMGRARVATTALSKAMWGLAAAMLKTPFGAIAVVVGSLIALFGSLSKKTHDINQSIDQATASIEAFNRTTKDTAQMIDEYEELSKKEKLTADEAKKLRDISRDLSNIFPKTTEGINQQTGALTLNIAKLREYNEQAEKALRKGMESEIKENAKQIRKNQKEIDKLTKQSNRGWARNKGIGLLSPIPVPMSSKQYKENAQAIVKLTDENSKLSKTNQELEDTLNGVTTAASKSAKETATWQDKLIEFNSRVDKEGKAIITISPDQIKNYTNLSDALEDIAKKYKEYDEQEKALTASIKGKTGAEKEELQGMLDRTTARKKLAKEELDYYNAFYLTQKKSGGRDDHLQRLRNQINDITNAYKKFIELRKYETKGKALLDIATFFPALKGWEPTYENMVTALETMLTQYKGDADATRIIEQAIANIKFDKVKHNLDESLKQLSEEIKRSETARNFFNNILELTGDNDLAATMSMSVYGQPGEEFKERVQRELYEALNSIDPKMIDKGLLAQLVGDTTTLDFDDLYAHLNELPDNVAQVIKRLRGEVEKYNDSLVLSLLKSLQKSKTYGEKQVEIARQSAKRIAQINSLTVDDSTKNRFLKQNAKKEAEETAKLQYEAFKDTPMYIELFANLDTASATMLKNMRNNLAAMKDEWKDLDLAPTELKELQSRINELDQQLARRNPIKAFVQSLKEYRKLTVTQSRKEADTNAVLATNRMEDEKRQLELLKKEYESLPAGSAAAEEAKAKMEAQAAVTDLAIEEAKAAQKTANKYREASKHIMDAADSMREWSGYVNDALGGIGEIVSTFASDDTAETFDIIASGIGKTMSGATDMATGIGKALSGDVIGGTAQAIKGLGSMISGIFGTGQQLKIKRINKQIEEQDRLITAMEYNYNRLGKAMEDAFGSDYIYNYNKQLEALRAQMEAYQKQAQLESQKGKKKDQKKIEEYNNAARDVQDQITDMEGQLAEFMSGTDLTSAAKDFAESWIEAYKQFGSTTDAMKEKFKDMVENMVVNSLAAQLIQSVLRPVFDAIDTASKDGELTAQEIGGISAMLPERMEMIDASMNNMMNELLAAGVNLRDQAGSMTGISRDIAGASEESILGLTAGINTQNFYMQHIDMNVAMILSTLTGGTTTAGSGTTGEYVDPYKDQMLAYVGTLPQMRDEMASIRAMLERVIRPVGAAATYYVSARM